MLGQMLMHPRQKSTSAIIVTRAPAVMVVLLLLTKSFVVQCQYIQNKEYSTRLRPRLRPKAEDHNQQQNQHIEDQYQDYFCLETTILVSRPHHCGVCVCVWVCLQFFWH